MARVLITGTSRGIGRVTALAAVARGHEVVGTARDPGALDDVPGLAARLALDVTDPASVEAALESADELDALISNAGDTTNGPVESVPVAEFRRMFELNTLGALQVAQPLVARFRRRGHGRLIFVSSVLGQVAPPFKSPYSASKWALEAIAEALAEETRPFELTVSLVEPGPVSGTSGRAAAASFFADDDPYRATAEAARHALDGAAVPVEEVAAAIVDTLEAEHPPLRVAVGEYAVEAIARKYGQVAAAS